MTRGGGRERKREEWNKKDVGERWREEKGGEFVNCCAVSEDWRQQKSVRSRFRLLLQAHRSLSLIMSSCSDLDLDRSQRGLCILHETRNIFHPLLTHFLDIWNHLCCFFPAASGFAW